MKLNLLFTLAMPIAFYAQDSIRVERQTEGYPDTFSSGSAYVEKFDNKARNFNDWSISIGGGSAFMHSADLTSFYGKKINWGWNSYVSLDKQISHSFGLSLQYQMGKTNQRGVADTNAWAAAVKQLPSGQTVIPGNWGVGEAWTKYQQISLLGDINFSNLLRRVDNHSPFKWALHGYAGVGFQGYKTDLRDNSTRWNNPLQIEQKLGIASFFYQAGTGLKYKISKVVDIEARVMYILSGDDEFDGGGWENSVAPDNAPHTISRKVNYPYNFIKKSNSDNMFTANLGLTFKLGKHLTHLAWYDPFQDAYARINVLENQPVNALVCEKGDQDNDGVCDDWDRQLDTPAGARVDGAGVALDMDLDGVIDLFDKCVTVPGPVENNGCPTSAPSTTYITDINKDFDGIEFALGSDVIRPQSYDKLNHAAEIIKSLDSASQFLVIGATDTRASETFNQTLSEKRARAVVNYLNSRGVNSGMLIAEGHGEKDLKYPECDPATKCPEWKNEANRRVYFKEK